MSFIISVPDSLRQSVEAASGGRITVIYDTNGYPSYMSVIPRFRYQDLGFASELGTGDCTAFIVDGQVKSEILVGTYQASNINGVPCSLPGMDPWRSISWTNARNGCLAKGAGWDMMTMHDWAAITLWCMANSFQPRGNTNHGRAHDATHEVGVRQDGNNFPPGDSEGVGNILAGTGPVAWRHDNTPVGIADLVGNLWEWQLGMKMVDGLLHVSPDNDTARDESEWITTINGNEHWLENNSGSPRLRNDQGVSEPAGSVAWGDLVKLGGYAESELLQRLLVSPAGIVPQGRFYANCSGERIPRRGGARNNGGGAGLAALTLADARSASNTGIGFRPRFAP